MKFEPNQVLYDGPNIFSNPCTINFIGSWHASNGLQMIIFSVTSEIKESTITMPLQNLTNCKELEKRLLNLTSIGIIAKPKDWGVFLAWTRTCSYNFIKKYPMFNESIRDYRLLKDIGDFTKGTIISAKSNSNGLFADIYKYEEPIKSDDFHVFGGEATLTIYFSDIGTIYEPLTKEEFYNQMGYR